MVEAQAYDSAGVARLSGENSRLVCCQRGRYLQAGVTVCMISRMATMTEKPKPLQALSGRVAQAISLVRQLAPDNRNERYVRDIKPSLSAEEQRLVEKYALKSSPA